MTHRKGAVWTERLLLVMILGSVAGTLNLVLTVQRRTAQVFSGPLTQPSAPSQSRMRRQFSNSAVISTGQPVLV